MSEVLQRDGVDGAQVVERLGLFDGLSDFEEVREIWMVAVTGSRDASEDLLIAEDPDEFTDLINEYTASSSAVLATPMTMA